MSNKETMKQKLSELLYKRDVELPLAKRKAEEEIEKLRKFCADIEKEDTRVREEICGLMEKVSSTGVTQSNESILDVVSRDRPLKCDECQKHFSLLTDLNGHMETAHISKKTHMCKVCKQLLTTKDAMRNHEKIQHQDLKHPCELCPKKFRFKYSLENHLRTHTGERPFRCNSCGKRFKQPASLKIHERCHTGEKPFQCRICRKMFSQKCNLKIHTRIHTGEKPFECNFCKTSFRNKAHLSRHDKTVHRKEKPFWCIFCSKNFTSSQSLTTHVRSHIGEKP